MMIMSANTSPAGATTGSNLRSNTTSAATAPSDESTTTSSSEIKSRFGLRDFGVGMALYSPFNELSSNLLDAEAATLRPSSSSSSSSSTALASSSLKNGLVSCSLGASSDMAWPPCSAAGLAKSEGTSSPWASVFDFPGPSKCGMNGWSSKIWSFAPPPPGFRKLPSSVCACEDTKQSVTARCVDCQEDLCSACVVAHQRVTITRSHTIRYYDASTQNCSAETGLSSSSANLQLSVSGTSSSMITAKPTLTSGCPSSLVTAPIGTRSTALSSYHLGTSDEIMKVYKDRVEKAKLDRKSNLDRANQLLLDIEEAKLQVTDMRGRIMQRHNAVYSEIKALSHKYIAEIQEVEKFLLGRLENINQVKLATLDQQKMDLTLSSVCLEKVIEQLTSCSLSGREVDVIDCCDSAQKAFHDITTKIGNLVVREDDCITYEPPSQPLLKSATLLGTIHGSCYGPTSFAKGEGLKKAILGKDAKFYVIIKDQLNEERKMGGDDIKIQITPPDARPVRYSFFDSQNGEYRVIWKPNKEGKHVINVTIKDKPIMNSPFEVIVRSGRDYSLIGAPVLTFGGEGTDNGMLCRPWGVCCSSEGYILVANRSNNRIEVYTSKGDFHHKFGTEGEENGQFNRPASVCCDSKNRVIVADKDNHRVQVFTIEGKFVFTFGEKGSKVGQFNYPWDVACNSQDQILVSDTRNHRIQLFSSKGEFVNKYGFEGPMWKHFDSPRGVCFTADDQAVVTDFNNHRLLVIRSDFQYAQFLGTEGNEDGMFMRPNGVAVDEEGHIIVADSRNDRIQVFTSSGLFLKKFGCKGSGPGEFDRPSGVCMSPEGHLVVVDFGNHRVQVF